MTGLFDELRLGLRFASTSRGAWRRLALSCVGIGIAVATLLAGASIPHLVHAQNAREAAIAPVVGPGRSSLQLYPTSTNYDGRLIGVSYVRRTGPRPPLPPGVTRIPRPGELVVSPRLAGLLRRDAALRAIFPGRIVQTISRPGLVKPDDLTAYVGSSDLTGSAIAAFGQSQQRQSPLPPLLLMLLVVGGVVLTFSIVVFVVTTSRLAAAEQDRRLAAIRLVGASASQARRIAAGESLAAALLGLVGGAALFLIGRSLAGHVLAGASFFPSDLVPATPLIVALALGLPAVAVAATIIGLRQTLIEPLGVVRRSAPRARRPAWRLLLAGLGALVVVASPKAGPGSRPEIALAAGVILVLMSTPAILPWLLQRLMPHMPTATPALQLATRRLQLDSATPTRVVSGVAVILAGGVALLSLLSASSAGYGAVPTHGRDGQGAISFTDVHPGEADRLAATLRRTTGVTAARSSLLLWSTHGDVLVRVGSCAALRLQAEVPRCHDGDVFTMAAGPVAPGSRIRFGEGATRIDWRVPADARRVVPDATGTADAVLATPAAAPEIPGDSQELELDLRYVPDSATTNRILAAVMPLQWHASTSLGETATPDTATRQYEQIRNALYLGALLALLVAGATTFVFGHEQVAERRRPFAALAAAGIPRRVIARSLAWQNAIPIVLGVALADVTGILLGSLLLPIVHQRVVFDLDGVAVISLGALLMAGLVTLLTLPAVRAATAPAELRSE